MKLKDILYAKKNKDIIHVSSNNTVAEAIKLMAERNVGDVVVMDGGKLSGIFTERDVLWCYAKGISFENEIMLNVMTKDPLTFDEATDVSYVLSTMCQKNIRHLPVVAAGEVVGVISFRDLVRYVMPEICYMADHIY